MDNAIQDKINQYVEKQEYWDIDEILIDEVVMEIATKYDFDFEFEIKKSKIIKRLIFENYTFSIFLLLHRLMSKE